MGFTCTHRLVDVLLSPSGHLTAAWGNHTQTSTYFSLKTICKVGENNEYLHHLKMMICFLPKSGNFSWILGA